MTDCAALEEFWEQELTRIDALIVAYSTAITSLVTNAVQSYTLDTGQTRQVVTKAQLGSLRSAYAELLALRSTIQARVCGATYHARPVD